MALPPDRSAGPAHCNGFSPPLLVLVGRPPPKAAAVPLTLLFRFYQQPSFFFLSWENCFRLFGFSLSTAQLYAFLFFFKFSKFPPQLLPLRFGMLSATLWSVEELHSTERISCWAVIKFFLCVLNRQRKMNETLSQSDNFLQFRCIHPFNENDSRVLL